MTRGRSGSTTQLPPRMLHHRAAAKGEKSAALYELPPEVFSGEDTHLLYIV